MMCLENLEKVLGLTQWLAMFLAMSSRNHILLKIQNIQQKEFLY